MSDQQDSTHERLRRSDKVKGSSNRSFGFVFAALFCIIGVWPLFKGFDPRYWALAVSGALFLVAILAPILLTPFNLVWFKFGLLLHRITNPLIMGLVFFLTVTPIGLIMRALGKDPLRLKIDKNAESYWIERAPPGPEPDSMKHQF